MVTASSPDQRTWLVVCASCNLHSLVRGGKTGRERSSNVLVYKVCQRRVGLIRVGHGRSTSGRPSGILHRFDLCTAQKAVSKPHARRCGSARLWQRQALAGNGVLAIINVSTTARIRLSFSRSASPPASPIRMLAGWIWSPESPEAMVTTKEIEDSRRDSSELSRSGMVWPYEGRRKDEGRTKEAAK